MLSSFVCAVCGKRHDGLLLDVAFRRPASFFGYPEEGREEHIVCNDDLCESRDGRYFIRGVLELPVVDTGDVFCWGLWVEVSERDFRRYLELWDAEDASSETPFTGRLDGEPLPYPGSDRLAVTVHLRPGNQRPRLVVTDDAHRLGRDQRQGVTLHQVHEFAGRYRGSASVG